MLFSFPKSALHHQVRKFNIDTVNYARKFAQLKKKKKRNIIIYAWNMDD